MPIYAFRCEQCDHEYEALVPRMGETAACPECGGEQVQRLLTAPADYRASGASDAPPCGPGGCATGQCPFA